MLRIVHAESATPATFELKGKLVGPWVDEARRVLASGRTREALCLNLEHLSFADAAGVDLLRALRGEGIRLVGMSPLIEGLLAAPARIVSAGEQ